MKFSVGCISKQSEYIISKSNYDHEKILIQLSVQPLKLYQFYLKLFLCFLALLLTNMCIFSDI